MTATNMCSNFGSKWCSPPDGTNEALLSAFVPAAGLVLSPFLQNISQGSLAALMQAAPVELAHNLNRRQHCISLQ